MRYHIIIAKIILHHLINIYMEVPTIPTIATIPTIPTIVTILWYVW